jgi:hypothetical protein
MALPALLSGSEYYTIKIKNCMRMQAETIVFLRSFTDLKNTIVVVK